MTSSITTIGTKTGRARRTFGQLWQIPMFFIGLAALLGVAASSPWRLTPQEADFRRYLINLRQDLTNESADGAALANQAENVLLRVGEFPRRAAEAHFLAGSAYILQAQSKPAGRAAETWTRAAQNLEKANAIGVAEADLPSLQYRLGYSLYRLNKDHTRAIDLMTMAVDKGSPNLADGYRALIDANLNAPTPNLDGALAASRRMLDLIPESQFEARSQARLQHAEMLLRKERRPDAIRELEQIGTKAPTPIRVKARLMHARACEAEGAWSDAVPIWSELLKDASHVPGGRAFIYYRLGWCYHEMKPANYNENIRAWTEAVKFGDVAGQAAGIHLGELRLALGGEHSAQALLDWSLALKNVKSADDFKNPLIEVVHLRKLLDRAYDTFQEQRDIEKTQTVAELYRRITQDGVADLRLAQTAEAYAQHLGDKLKEKIAGVQEGDVFDQYRRAGQAYVNASNAPDAKDRTDSLWRSIQCYLAARDVARAQQVLLQYVNIETDEERLAEAWFTIGDLYQITGQKEKAYTAFVKCIEFPDTVFAARSDFHIAEVEIENKNFKRAEEILTKIVTGASNHIDAQTREKSYFRLASLLFAAPDQLAKAQIYLKACVTLYPANSNNLVVRDQLGECCRRLATAEMEQEIELRKKIQLTNATDRQQLADRLSNHRLKRKEWLKEAEQSYLGLLTVLMQRKSAKEPLKDREEILWRRAKFGIGDCELDNESYSEALRSFQEIQTKHRGTLESLYACNRLVDTIDLMMPTSTNPTQLKEQALESLTMLLADLSKLPETHEMFQLQRVPSRANWLDWATKTRTRLAAPANKEATLPVFP